jgi:hypothetical protein
MMRRCGAGGSGAGTGVVAGVVATGKSFVLDCDEGDWEPLAPQAAIRTATPNDAQNSASPRAEILFITDSCRRLFCVIAVSSGMDMDGRRWGFLPEITPASQLELPHPAGA